MGRLILVLGVPKTTPRFHDSLGLKGLSLWLYLWLSFVKAKRYKAESAKGKGTVSEVWKKPLPRHQLKAVLANRTFK